LCRHRNWLAGLAVTDPGLLAALDCQAAHERNQHAARALEAFVNLAEVYAQQPILSESQELLHEARQVAEKFQAAGLSPGVDPSEFDRQELGLLQKRVDAGTKQTQLQDGLTYLLRLESDPEAPLWPDWSAAPQTDWDEADCVQLAWAQRGDLRALESLASSGSTPGSDAAVTAAVSAGLPGTQVGLNLPRPLAWWQCGLRDELESLERETARHRREQLRRLAEEKRREIEREVRALVASYRGEQALWELQQQELLSVDQALAAAEAAAGERPIDFQTDLQLRQRRLQLSSEILSRRFALELQQIRLHQALGHFGR
jgi:hypothetical protein